VMGGGEKNNAKTVRRKVKGSFFNKSGRLKDYKYSHRGVWGTRNPGGGNKEMGNQSRPILRAWRLEGKKVTNRCTA